ncbi:MAG: PilZ domain-containing protein [Nitrospinae bacterium]|nr:PilZ domain-containing protein [Nitrospinota bacterium]
MDEFLHHDFSSVESSIPLAISPATETAGEELGSRMAANLPFDDGGDLPELGDKALQRWFKTVDAKLNAILHVLHTDDSEFRGLPYRRVVISGAGIKVFGPEGYPEGTVVEMRVLLPSAPPAAMYLAGRVVRRDEEAVYVGYLRMGGDLRDRIVHYVFLRQREILRGKKEQ